MTFAVGIAQHSWSPMIRYNRVEPTKTLYFMFSFLFCHPSVLYTEFVLSFGYLAAARMLISRHDERLRSFQLSLQAGSLREWLKLFILICIKNVGSHFKSCGSSQ